MKRLNIALLGCGVVGSGVYRILTERRRTLAHATGVDLRVTHVCVRDPARERPVSVPPAILSAGCDSVLDDPAIDVVVEVIGGERDALGVISRALVQGRSVVTANKEVVARHLPTLRRLERLHGGLLLYGASVCGSIPVLKIIDETLAADRITSLRGIVNGSTNYILSRMSEGCAWHDALESARLNGFLEADPTDDLSGADAARKLSILTWHAFGRHVPPERISTTGLGPSLARDVASARATGGSVKLIAEAIQTGDGLFLSVAPRVLGPADPLAKIDDEVNAVEIECAGIGSQRFAGKGAGSMPTANAVVSDLLDIIARRAYLPRPAEPHVTHASQTMVPL